MTRTRAAHGRPGHGEHRPQARDRYGVGMEDDEIRVLVARLARPHPSGGTVIERAAIIAQGTGSEDVIAWVVAHGGVPEATVETSAPSGLHGRRHELTGGGRSKAPSRFVLPPDALDTPA